MTYAPTTQLAIAREWQADLLAEAERHRLAAAVRGEKPNLRDRIAALLRRAKHTHGKHRASLRPPSSF
jgi:hypothetical protein